MVHAGGFAELEDLEIYLWQKAKGQTCSMFSGEEIKGCFRKKQMMSISHAVFGSFMVKSMNGA